MAQTLAVAKHLDDLNKKKASQRDGSDGNA